MKQLLQNKVGHEQLIETNTTQFGCTDSFFLNLKLLIKFSKCSFKFLITLCEVFIPLGERKKKLSHFSPVSLTAGSFGFVFVQTG